MAQPVRRPTGPPPPRTAMLLMRVWDAPTRLFHWLIVLLVAFSYASINLNWFQLHLLSGYTVLTLLLFRIVWGFCGSETARFRRFLRSPVAGFRHLGSLVRREPDREIGHNAAGGWMVLLMLLSLAVQTGTGLFSGDPVDGEGPLGHLAAGRAQKLLTEIHQTNFYVLLGLIVLHVLAVLAYAAFKRHDLVRPMVTGKKRLPANMRQPRFVSPILALLIVIGAAACVWALVSLA